MVVSFRIALQERSGDRSKATHTALQYNITGIKRKINHRGRREHRGFTNFLSVISVFSVVIY